MRVGIFFDGKNFYSGWRATAEDTTIDFVALSEWLVKKVGGLRLAARRSFHRRERGGCGEQLYAKNTAILRFLGVPCGLCGSVG